MSVAHTSGAVTSAGVAQAVRASRRWASTLELTLRRRDTLAFPPAGTATDHDTAPPFTSPPSPGSGWPKPAGTAPVTVRPRASFAPFTTVTTYVTTSPALSDGRPLDTTIDRPAPFETTFGLDWAERLGSGFGFASAAPVVSAAPIASAAPVVSAAPVASTARANPIATARMIRATTGRENVVMPPGSH